MHYTAVSYYSLGRVSPRERLREPYPQAFRFRRMAGSSDPYSHTPPVPVTVTAGTDGVTLTAGTDGTTETGGKA